MLDGVPSRSLQILMAYVHCCPQTQACCSVVHNMQSVQPIGRQPFQPLVRPALPYQTAACATSLQCSFRAFNMLRPCSNRTSWRACSSARFFQGVSVRPCQPSRLHCYPATLPGPGMARVKLHFLQLHREAGAVWRHACRAKH
jgi:hypothetical protein